MSGKREDIDDGFVRHLIITKNIRLVYVSYMNNGFTKCFAFSAHPNPAADAPNQNSVKEANVGFVVFLTGDKISIPLTTGSPLLEGNFDYESLYQPIPTTDKIVFGAFKLMMEMAEVANKISDCEKWRSDNAKLLVDNFRSIDKAIIKDLQEKKLPENDPIVSHILARQEEMYHILEHKESYFFLMFKEQFIVKRRDVLELLPRTIPREAKETRKLLETLEKMYLETDSMSME